jgi:hypothetical protein
MDVPVAHEATATFRSSYTPVELTEQLGSDTPARLTAAVAPLEALATCGKVTFVTDRRSVPVTVGKRAAAVGGAKGTSFTLTFDERTVQLTVFRMGPVLLSLSGDPDLIDSLLPAAVAKVTKATNATNTNATAVP